MEQRERDIDEKSLMRLTQSEKQHGRNPAGASAGDVLLTQEAQTVKKSYGVGGVTVGQLTARFDYEANTPSDRRHCG